MPGYRNGIAAGHQPAPRFDVTAQTRALRLGITPPAGLLPNHSPGQLARTGSARATLVLPHSRGPLTQTLYALPSVPYCGRRSAWHTPAGVPPPRSAAHRAPSDCPLPEGARSLPKIRTTVRLPCARAPQPITTQRGKALSLPRPTPAVMPPRRRRQATLEPCNLWYLRWTIYSWILALNFWPSAHK